MAQRIPAGDGGAKRTSQVRVAVRLRPYMAREDDKTEGPCVRGLDAQNLEIINWRNATETVRYHFDAFHDENTTQQGVFLASVKPILPHILSGQNASVFAYGPTGAGKTHTMLGTPEHPGMIPRAIREVFNLVRLRGEEQEDWDYSVAMSYLEIYNEKVLDLLSTSPQDLPIREDKDHNILIPGLTQTPLTSFANFDRHFIPASLNRTTASTKLNQRSSRSHAILLIKVVRTQRCPPHRQQTGKLYLVDLAGSEDNRRTGNQGIRLKESGAINLSLFTLSKVVDSLNATGAGVRVPYRDSKLTRLLQDSLGGSAHAVMIANIAPEYAFYFDTFSALNFAAKSKLVVNKPFVRETLTVPVPRVKRAREEKEAEPQKKKPKGSHKANTASPSAPPDSGPSDPSVLGRLIALEKMMMGSQEMERRTMKQSLKELQELKERQKALESQAGVGGVSRETSLSSQDSVFRNALPLQQRKPVSGTAAKPKKQQAVVLPLQVSQPQPLQQNMVAKKSVCRKKTLSDVHEVPDCKENMGPPDWESHLDSSLVQRSRQKILAVLNSGSLKDLKDLQQIGDKKAKLILGWREIHGHFTRLEDLIQIEGITEKRFSSFMKANLLSFLGIEPLQQKAEDHPSVSPSSPPVFGDDTVWFRRDVDGLALYGLLGRDGLYCLGGREQPPPLSPSLGSPLRQRHRAGPSSPGPSLTDALPSASAEESFLEQADGGPEGPRSASTAELVIVINDKLENREAGSPVVSSPPRRQHSISYSHPLHHPPHHAKTRKGSRASSVGYTAFSPRPSLSRHSSIAVAPPIDRSKVKDYMLLSVLACFCPVWPVNLVGFVFSIMVGGGGDDDLTSC
ncbi:hypothetical protein NHX12_025534 [Muraenolepis orangiensis]|uniref:Kinesin-like protein n=1 Tax=Muraenolepis orangiensis TaxID=630683 RepID=A0A9Q0IPQ8_9TELE|nr:hypothetical protein NHX12_025534 [Muraenolepis orangiensis]